MSNAMPPIEEKKASEMGQPPDALNFDDLSAQLNVIGDSKPNFGEPK